MGTLYTRLSAVVFAALAFLIVAPFAEDAKAAVGDENKITCMYPTWVGYGPIHVANELGFFKDEGITVEETIDDDMANAVAAMERGDIDCYLRTVGEFQGLGRRKTTQGIIIGTIDLSLGGDGWAADGSIKTVCDLKGKTIAVEPNLPARLLMQMALKKECNLSIKDTNLTDLAAADAIGAFSDKSLAAVGTYEPVLSQVIAAHQDRGAHILASSKDYNDLILDIIMAHTGELHAHPDKYVKFLRALYRAVDYFYANEDKAIPIIAKQFSITPDDFKATLPNFRYTPFDEAKMFMGTPEKPGRVYDVFNEAMDLNLEFGAADVKLFPEDHIDPSIINKVEKNW
jgi:NitT/TauT family transport system substrate-binding protein